MLARELKRLTRQLRLKFAKVTPTFRGKSEPCNKKTRESKRCFQIGGETKGMCPKSEQGSLWSLVPVPEFKGFSFGESGETPKILSPKALIELF